MKAFNFLVVSSILLVPDLWAEPYAPSIHPSERYQPIWSRKPFRPATPVAAESSIEGIEQQYALGGLLRMGDEWVAFVLDRKTLERHRVSSTANENGLQLISVQEEADSKTSSVVLSLNGKTGTVRFDSALLASATTPDPPSQIGKGPEAMSGPVSHAQATVTPKPVRSGVAAPGNPLHPPSATRTLRRTVVNLTP